jgi:hypothetical protein
MNPDLYSKPVDQLMEEGKISISYYPIVPGEPNQWGQVQSKSGENWVAQVRKPRFIEGSGPTPRQAIIDLYKKLK